MVSPVSEDATEDLQKLPGTLEAQALVEQELLHAEVRSTFLLSLFEKQEFMAPELPYVWMGWI